MTYTEIGLALTILVAILLASMIVAFSARADLGQIMILSFLLLSITLLNFLRTFQDSGIEKDN
jgi:c-di-AMP phosphodiesterase-like protein